MDRGANMLYFSDNADHMEGVITLEPDKKKEQLRDIPISAPQQTTSFLDQYKIYCDINTSTVVYRLKKTLWPFNEQKFFESKADLYGAFWIPTTLIFILLFSCTLSLKISDPSAKFDPQALIVTSAMVYTFVFSVPAVLSFAIFSGAEISYMELTSLYGYSYFLFWPAALVSVLNFSFVRWISFGVSSVLAGALLTKNFYNEIEFLQGWTKYASIIISLSGYIVLTVVANLYLFS